MALHYISSFSVGTLHSMVNRALLRMSLQSGNPVVCHAPSSAIESLQDAVVMDDNAAAIGWRRLHIPSGSGRVALLMRYLCSAVVNVWLLLCSRRDDILLYDFNNVMSTRLLDLVNRWKRRKVLICCHGEMEYLAEDAPEHNRRLYKRLMLNLTRGYFNSRRAKVAPNLHFLVFGDAILDNLRPLLSDALFERFSAIDHPVDEPLIAAKTGAAGDTVNIGTVGILNEHKGSDIYPEIASRLAGCGIRFSVVGHVQCPSQPLVDAGIALTGDASRPLSADEFASAVARLDYILLLYPSDTYRLIASGALLDAVRFRRPVIALRTDYFSYIFSRFGAIGYLADDVDSLVDLLRNWRTLDRSFDFDAVARALSAVAQSPRFLSILSSL